MKFIIRESNAQDVPEIMQIMHSAAQNGTPLEWYVTDTEEEVKKVLQKGIVLVAENENTVAGFFIAKYPDLESNLGIFLDYSEKQLAEVVLMDSAAVAPAFRGFGLQGKMLEEIEKRINWQKYHYAMCTVHPNNKYSLHNMQKHGYEVKKTVKCYGENIRHVLVKEF